MEEIIIAVIIWYVTFMALFGVTLFESINPKGFKQMMLFTTACLFWWLVAIVLFILPLWSIKRKRKREGQ